MNMVELSKLAGCSQATVSRVLNHPECCKASKTTREKILLLARQNNFRVNRAAVSLRLNKSHSVGIQMPLSYQPQKAIKASMLQNLLAKKGYQAVFSFQNTSKDIPSSLNSLLAFNLDGLITVDYVPLLKKETLPIVFWDSVQEGYDAVIQDDRYYVKNVCESIFIGRHSRVAYILGALPRLNLLRQAVEEKQIEIIDFTRQDLLYPKSSYKIMKGLLSAKNPPSLILTNDYLASGVYAAVREAGLRIPEDISVIGLDNLPSSEYMDPPLSSFDQDITLSTSVLVDMLLTRMQQPDKPVSVFKVSPRFIKRHSTRL